MRIPIATERVTQRSDPFKPGLCVETAFEMTCNQLIRVFEILSAGRRKKKRGFKLLNT